MEYFDTKNEFYKRIETRSLDKLTKKLYEFVQFKKNLHSQIGHSSYKAFDLEEMYNQY